MKKLLTGITLIAVASLANAENLQSNGFSYDYVQGIYGVDPVTQYHRQF